MTNRKPLSQIMKATFFIYYAYKMADPLTKIIPFWLPFNN